jgi:hypothetical protein
VWCEKSQLRIICNQLVNSWSSSTGIVLPLLEPFYTSDHFSNSQRARENNSNRFNYELRVIIHKVNSMGNLQGLMSPMIDRTELYSYRKQIRYDVTKSLQLFISLFKDMHINHMEVYKSHILD